MYSNTEEIYEIIEGIASCHIEKIKKLNIGEKTEIKCIKNLFELSNTNNIDKLINLFGEEAIQHKRLDPEPILDSDNLGYKKECQFQTDL